MATSVSKLIIRLQKFSSKISTTVEATASFNSKGYHIQDLSGWDSAVVQFGTISAEDTITFKTTNDNGSVEGQLLPAPEVPENFTPVMGINLATKANALVASNDSIIEFGIIGKYLLLEGNDTDTLSYAYVLSQNAYDNALEAYNIGILQGTRIVYTTTATLTTANKLYTDNRLTQPIVDDGTSWYGIAVLNDQAVKYAITISSAGVIFID
jgi:hypothetical protein